MQDQGPIHLDTFRFPGLDFDGASMYIESIVHQRLAVTVEANLKVLHTLWGRFGVEVKPCVRGLKIHYHDTWVRASHLYGVP